MSSLPMDSKHNPAQFVSAHAQSSIHYACVGMPHQQRQPPAQRALPRAYPLHKGRWLLLSHKIVREGCLATVTKFTASVHSEAWMLVLPWGILMVYCGASSDICSKGFKKHFHLQHFQHNMYIYANNFTANSGRFQFWQKSGVVTKHSHVNLKGNLFLHYTSSERTSFSLLSSAYLCRYVI